MQIKTTFKKSLLVQDHFTHLELVYVQNTYKFLFPLPICSPSSKLHLESYLTPVKMAVINNTKIGLQGGMKIINAYAKLPK